MVEHPDPDPDPTTLRSISRVPVFPLPGLFLYPGQLLPLHFFEDRYRQMVNDMLDGPGRIVVVSQLQSETDDEAPAMLGIGGLGELARHERLPDGRFLTWIIGLSRARLNEIDSDRPYRMVEYDLLEETEPNEFVEDELRNRLASAFEARTNQGFESDEEVSVSQLADLLAQLVAAPQKLMESIYCEVDVVIRAERVLRALEDYPPPPTEEA